MTAIDTLNTNKRAYFTATRMARWGRNTVCALTFGWAFPHPELPDEEDAPAPIAAKIVK